jgi:protoporphyrinogen oxidase
LKESLLKEGSYWLNINEMDYPFLALVEHTNLINKKFYNNENLLYVAKYLSSDHKYFNYNEDQLLEEYLPFLKKINKYFDKNMINKAWIFKSDYTQPVVEVNRSSITPPFETPIKGLYLCNMEQIYPWDRGTNYAINLGNQVAELVLKSKYP